MGAPPVADTRGFGVKLQTTDPPVTYPNCADRGPTKISIHHLSHDGHRSAYLTSGVTSTSLRSLSSDPSTRRVLDSDGTNLTSIKGLPFFSTFLLWDEGRLTTVT